MSSCRVVQETNDYYDSLERVVFERDPDRNRGDDSFGFLTAVDKINDAYFSANCIDIPRKFSDDEIKTHRSKQREG